MATFWSTSRNELWTKGETSGDFLKIIDIYIDCDQDALIYRVEPQGGGACHTRIRRRGQTSAVFIANSTRQMVTYNRFDRLLSYKEVK